LQVTSRGRKKNKIKRKTQNNQAKQGEKIHNKNKQQQRQSSGSEKNV